MDQYHPDEEDVPAMIVEEMEKINAMFHVACTRRGQRRETAWNELREELRHKLWSQHKMHQEELLYWKLRATEKSKNEELVHQNETIGKSLMTIHGEKYELINENRDLKEEIITLKNKLSAKENNEDGGEIAGASRRQQ